MSDYDDELTTTLSAADLRRVARYHRWLVAVLLAQLGLWFAYLFLGCMGFNVFDNARLPVILTFILGAVGGIYTFLLYATIKRPIVGIVLGLAAFFPCLGILVFLVVNGTAAVVLRAAGVKVGMLGVHPDAIPEDYDVLPEDDEDPGW